MKKIKLVCLLSLFCCSCSEVSTSSIQQNNSIQKLEVNYTNVKDTYFLGEKLDLSIFSSVFPAIFIIPFLKHRLVGKELNFGEH